MAGTCFYSERVLPSVYGDEFTYYEELNALCNKMAQLIDDFAKQKETYATIKMLQESQDAQDKKWAAELKDQYDSIMGYTKGEIQRLEKIIAETIAGKVTIFDPTYGIEPRSVETVIGQVYHWLRYYADYAEVIDALNLTVETRDGYALDAKTFDLYSTLYYSHNETPMPLPLDNYVQKHDILAYYFDRQV